MRRLLLATAALLPALTLGACVGEGYYGGRDGYGYAGPVAYDGYYDDFYGPVYDGYWGTDGAFYDRGGDHERLFVAAIPRISSVAPRATDGPGVSMRCRATSPRRVA